MNPRGLATQRTRRVLADLTDGNTAQPLGKCPGARLGREHGFGDAESMEARATSELGAGPRGSMVPPVMPGIRGMGRPASHGSTQVADLLLPPHGWAEPVSIEGRTR